MTIDTDSLKKRLAARKAKPEAKGLSSGSTLLNLACSGSPDYCYLTGGYYYFVGNSASGKTWLVWNALAEACHSDSFKDYRVVFNNAENGSLMDTAKFFGQKTKDRTEILRSPDLDHLYAHLHTLLGEKKPFIYVLDSMDALRPREDNDNARKTRDGKKTTGSYGMAKAKLNSGNMPEINAGLVDTKSILILISQTRTNIGPMAQYNPYTRSGGTALTFYSQLEMWTSVKEKIKKNVRGIPLKVGILSKINVKKNRLTGKDRTVLVPIYNTIGVDDLGSCIDWLVTWKHWSETKGVIKAPEFDFSGKLDTLVAKLEEEGLEGRLREIVTGVWQEVEGATEVKRKRRYE